ncbi:hypothetical protein [Campylobacter lanienae]|uniref:hypothetical protein n=1 Tax=Campylobacter lanienae TaxID=75658 RepID=UPI00191C7FB0|nr:hypothetical protein [Campylobacter lanienae]
MGRGTPRSGALGGRGECNSLPQTATLLPCGVKWGTPRSGALGGSRECNSLPQTATLLPCGVKIVCYFRHGFATPLKVGKNKKRGIPIKIRGVSHPLKGFYRGLGVVKWEGVAAAKKRSPSHLKEKIYLKFKTH